MKQHFVGAFGEWVLGLHEWQAFGTFTFKQEVSTELASSLFENFLVRAAPEVKCFYSVERHKAHGGHLHALLGDLGEFTSRPAGPRILVTGVRGVDLWETWFRRYGRNSIELPNDKGACGRYVAKYITKEAAAWSHNLTGEFRKQRTEIEVLASYVFPNCTVVEE